MTEISLFYFLVSFLSSIIGAVSGIGGGVLIKPTLDLLSKAGVDEISFMSGCTVLAMTIVTLFRSRTIGVNIPKRTASLLAFGSVVGGLAGKYLFDLMIRTITRISIVGAVQSLVLALMCQAVLVFTLNRHRIWPRHQHGNLITVLLGLILGCIASFIGIGGGPINLSALYFFFSMDSKTAALSSLYIIFFSQLTNLIFTIASGTVPDISVSSLLIMISGAVCGAVLGSELIKRLSLKGVDKVFSALMLVLFFISSYNFFKYLGLV